MRLLCVTAFSMVLIGIWFLYQPGLSGPLVLDDQPNLRDVTRYLDGEKTAVAVIMDNRSGRLGRPIAMASFLADAQLWGNSTWHAKATNVAIHLACGSLVFLLVFCLLLRSGFKSNQALFGAAFLGLIWLVLPVHVSTVLYLIQRMAQLSVFFILLGLIVYLLARTMLEKGDWRGLPVLFMGVPLATVAAMLSKENGALLPILALAVELVWFRPETRRQRPISVKIFFSITVALPLLALVVLVAMRQEAFFGGYELRHFSLIERLMTQPRVLWDYTFSTLFPIGSRFGIFHDYYPISRTLFSPWTTIPAIVAWLGLAALCWQVRVRYPLLLGGLLIFLVGHSMEGSVFPLEIYFEHRNYFPSMGLLLMLLGLFQFSRERLSVPTRSFRRIFPIAVLFFPVVYAGVTFNQVLAWSTLDSFYRYQYRHHADSMRLQSYMLGLALERSDFLVANAHIDEADRVAPMVDMMAPAVWRFLAYCAIDEEPRDGVYSELERRALSPLTRYDMMAMNLLSTKVESGECPGIDVARISNVIQVWLENSDLPNSYMEKWRVRYYLSRMNASMGSFELAVKLAEDSWRDSHYNRGIGVYLFQLNATLGNEAVCQEILDRLEHATGGGDLLFDRAIKTFGEALENGLENWNPSDGAAQDPE